MLKHIVLYNNLLYCTCSMIDTITVINHCKTGCTVYYACLCLINMALIAFCTNNYLFLCISCHLWLRFQSVATVTVLFLDHARIGSMTDNLSSAYSSYVPRSNFITIILPVTPTMCTIPLNNTKVYLAWIDFL